MPAAPSPHSHGRREIRPPRGEKPVRDDAYGLHTAIALTVNRFLLRHMVRLYRAFDGDLLECIVLGQIAHHNVAGLLGDTRTEGEFAERLATRGRPRPEDLLPANAQSIARATGIPRETVRRKVRSLVQRGWLAIDARSNLSVTRAPAGHFRELSERSIRELLEVASIVGPLLQRQARAAGVRGERSPRR